MYESVSSYFASGIVLREGSTVFDVGSNIGMVSLLLSWQYNKQISIYAFEPIDEIFNILKSNIDFHKLENIVPLNIGLSSQAGKEIFSYYPRLPSMSSMYAYNSQDEINMLIESILKNFRKGPSICKKLGIVPSILRKPLLKQQFRSGLSEQKVSCDLKTISQVIKENNIRSIDWLKIDTEKSEMKVLEGIKDHDWAKIHQLSIEVHDIENRLNKIKILLQNKGYTDVVVCQEGLLERSKIYLVHAMRKCLVANNLE